MYTAQGTCVARGAVARHINGKEIPIDFLRFLSDLAHIPDSWRQWVGAILTLAAALCVPVFVKSDIAVVYIVAILLAGGVAISFWEGSARSRKARNHQGK